MTKMTFDSVTTFTHWNFPVCVNFLLCEMKHFPFAYISVNDAIPLVEGCVLLSYIDIIFNYPER